MQPVDKQRIHLIAVGGAVMHQLAIALQTLGHTVTGSDDEIYNPARDHLTYHELLPDRMGWHPERIDDTIDSVIVGMHARRDNPELLKAQELGIPIYSYPEYIYAHSTQKKRVVLAGSHGKTTTTAMVMHVLRYHDIDFDYLVGARLAGFDRMVRLSYAPIIVIEGDEYLSAPTDRRSKFLHYKPHIAVITGIAWDHINVFPTFESYLDTFEKFVASMPEESTLIYYQHDMYLPQLVKDHAAAQRIVAYQSPPYEVADDHTLLHLDGGERRQVQVFGQHNLENMQAARLACLELGVGEEQFYEAIASFTGAAKRLQHLGGGTTTDVYLDFAHAPSKVKATTTAMQERYAERRLVAVVELHTFSSLSRDFLPHYANALDGAERAYVYYSPHTLAMKKMPQLSPEEVGGAFRHPNLEVYTDAAALREALLGLEWADTNLLIMTSGQLGGTDFKKLANAVTGGKN